VAGDEPRSVRLASDLFHATLGIDVGDLRGLGIRSVVDSENESVFTSKHPPQSWNKRSTRDLIHSRRLRCPCLP